jgi:hypothetical protein
MQVPAHPPARSALFVRRLAKCSAGWRNEGRRKLKMWMVVTGVEIIRRELAHESDTWCHSRMVETAQLRLIVDIQCATSFNT